MSLCHITNRQNLIANKEIRVYNKLHLPHDSVCKNNIYTPYNLRTQMTGGRISMGNGKDVAHLTDSTEAEPSGEVRT